MINVKFTPRVGTAPGTTTMAIDGTGSDTLCRNLGASDTGPCLPEAPDSYMTSPGRANLPSQAAQAAMATAAIPYGTESELKDHMLNAHLISYRQSPFALRPEGLGAHALDYRQTPGLGMNLLFGKSSPHYRRPNQLVGLNAAPFGLSWGSLFTLVGIAAAGGVGLAWLASRR